MSKQLNLGKTGIDSAARSIVGLFGETRIKTNTAEGFAPSLLCEMLVP